MIRLLFLAREVLSQLSDTPKSPQAGLEPASIQLRYSV
jgi:hypothetical protein